MFTNKAGGIRVTVKDNKSYLCFEIYDLQSSRPYDDANVLKRFCFVREENLSEPPRSTVETLLPHSQSLKKE